MKQLILALVFAGSIQLVSTAASADGGRLPECHPRWRLVVLPNLGGESTADTFVNYANAINNRHEVVGAAVDGNGNGQPFVWRDEHMVQLPLLSSFTAGEALAIDDEGSIGGDNYSASAEEPAIWNGASVHEVTKPGNEYGGNIVELSDIGWRAETDFTDTGSQILVSGFGSTATIALAGWDYTFAAAMNSTGLLGGLAEGVASGNNDVTSSQGYLYNPWTKKTTLFKPFRGDDSTLVQAVTTNGAVYGFSYNGTPGDGTQSVVRFNLGSNGGEILRTEPNGNGFVVANDELIVESYQDSQPAIVRLSDKWVNLNGLIDGLGTFTVDSISAINDPGDMTGWGTLANGNTRAFVLLRGE